MRRVLLSGAIVFFLSGPVFSATPEELEVRNVVESGNEAWVEAQRTLDPVPLRIWFRDQALQDFQEDLALSRKSDSVALLDPPKLDFEKTTIDAQKREATVVTLETWEYSAHRLGSGECLFRGGPNTTRVTYRLKRNDERWQVVSTASEAQGERAPTRPCEVSKRHPQ